MIKTVKHFVKNGADTFRCAAKGRYKSESPAVSALKNEIFGQGKGYADDKKNLRNDWKRVEGDVRKAYNKIVSK
jgi:hypothetical protein